MRQLRREAGPTVDVRPWVDNVASVYAAADVILAKAGPSTIFEAEAVGMLLLLTDEVGAQEHGNIELAERRGIGVRCSRPDLVPGYVRDELSALHVARPLASPDDSPSTVIARGCERQCSRYERLVDAAGVAI